MSIEVEALDHVTVQITDVEQSRKFYGEFLGLEEMERPESFDFAGAWFRTNNALIHLVVQPTPDPETQAHFCLWVADIGATFDICTSEGFAPQWNKRKIPGLNRFFIRDPDGNRIEFQGSDGTVWSA